MKTLKHQRGMSILVGIIVLIAVGFIGLVGLKLFPVYMESLKIGHALNGLIEDPGITEQSKRDIAFGLVRRLDIDGVYLIKESNWTEYVTITTVRKKVTVVVSWRREIPLFANLSLVASFTKEASNQP